MQENIRIDEVKLRRKYINSGDVFILDLGLKIIQVCLFAACVYTMSQCTVLTYPYS